MTSTTSLHSNALNFMDFVSNGVDPRTGQYTVAVSLPGLGANDLRGPDAPLSLSYNPLNTDDSGFGLGWSLSHSQLDITLNVLSLDSGERLKITGGDPVSGRQIFAEQKIDSFHLYSLGSGAYRLVHKNGREELLQVRGNADKRMAVPVRIFAQTGHSVYLDYATFNDHPLLEQVRDDTGKRLLTLTRAGSRVLIEVHPDSDEPALYEMHLGTTSQRVDRIVLPSDERAAWHFDYNRFNDQLRIIQVDSPSGARENIYYEDEGHAYPSGPGTPLQKLPRVTRHVVRPGAGQADVDVHYSYPDGHNFLGAGLHLGWNNDGLDNLFRHADDYDYRTREELHVDSVLQRSIERTFNRFHLLTEEVTTQGDYCKTVSTTYPSIAKKPFADQPRQCQLPSEVKTTWSRVEDTRYRRSETVSSEFYDHGGLNWQTQANGITETSLWFPADAEGFVRALQSKTVTPAPGLAAAPVLRTQYTYMTLPALDGSEMPDWQAPHTETLIDVDAMVPLLTTTHLHNNTPDNALLHGQVMRENRLYNQFFESFTLNQWERSLDNDLPVIRHTQTLGSSFDDARHVTSNLLSPVTGQVLQTLVEGVETRYRYDRLGRVLQETIAPDLDEAASRTYRYTLCAEHGEQAEQSVTDARGVETRSLLDGLARVVREERNQVDALQPGLMHVLYEARHDAWGRVYEETRHDWLQGRDLALTSRFGYDPWGSQSTVIGPDGVERHEDSDPIGAWDNPQAVVTTWTQGSGSDAPRSNVTRTWMNLFGKPDHEASLDAQGQAIQAEEFYVYDGLGRCIESRDPNNQVTRYRYDAWSRLVWSQLPDATTVERDYAAHSEEELATAIRVTDHTGTVTVGEQTFDSLQRPTSLTVGARREQYRYSEGQLPMSQRVTGAGTLIDYRYNLALTREPAAIEVPQLQASYEYHPVSARLLRASNTQGSREYDYDVHNRLLAERWVDQGNTWETRYTTSLLGMPIITRQPGGLQTLHDYDDKGQVKSLAQGDLLATFVYDALGRMHSVVTRDQSTPSRLETTLQYDDQGRETCRTLALDRHPTQTIRQTWRRDGLLGGRHWQQGSLSLLEEVFDYDARGRLSGHTCSGSQLPADNQGRRIVEQVFSYSALDNIKNVLTVFEDGTDELARHTYDPDSPCLLTGIVYNPPRAQANPTFKYDADGNQLNDLQGRTMRYDSLGRLTGVEDPAGQSLGQYRYDGQDQLVSQQQGDASATLCFYEDERLSGMVRDGKHTSLLHGPDTYAAPLGQQQPGDPAQTLLTLCDANRSVRGECQQGRLRQAVYSAYGEQQAEPPLAGVSGFNGEWQDPSSGWYLLGSGYRAYDPQLKRFHSPDNLSPFGEGGFNPYTYCLGNPIALRDPTGHQGIGFAGQLRSYRDKEGNMGGDGGLLSWVMLGVGVIGTAIAVVLAVLSFGLLTPVAGGAAAATAAAATTAAGATAATAPSVSAVVTVVAMSTSAALAVGSTSAQIVSIVKEDEAASTMAAWLGIGSFIAGMVGSVSGGIAHAARKAMEAGLEPAKHAGRQAGLLNGANQAGRNQPNPKTFIPRAFNWVKLKPFRLPRPRTGPPKVPPRPSKLLRGAFVPRIRPSRGATTSPGATSNPVTATGREFINPMSDVQSAVNQAPAGPIAPQRS